MPKAMKICRVCGKEYEYCHTARRVPGVFRWQDVACSPECGGKYLAEIRASRSNDVVETPSVETPVVKIAEILDEYEPDEDSVFDDEEDFEDDEEFDEDSEM